MAEPWGGVPGVGRASASRSGDKGVARRLHDAGDAERFLQEARAASALNHPNICTVFDIGEQERRTLSGDGTAGGRDAEGEDRAGALSAEEIVHYRQEIAGALAVAHAKGIVHRDIKPANIFLVNRAEWKESGEGAGLWAGKDRAGDAAGGLESRQAGPDAGGSDGGDAVVHVAGTGAGQSAGCAVGSVLAGRGDV